MKRILGFLFITLMGMSCVMSVLVILCLGVDMFTDNVRPFVHSFYEGLMWFIMASGNILTMVMLLTHQSDKLERWLNDIE